MSFNFFFNSSILSSFWSLWASLRARPLVSCQVNILSLPIFFGSFLLNIHCWSDKILMWLIPVCWWAFDIITYFVKPIIQAISRQLTKFPSSLWSDNCWMLSELREHDSDAQFDPISNHIKGLLTNRCQSYYYLISFFLTMAEGGPSKAQLTRSPGALWSAVFFFCVS